MVVTPDNSTLIVAESFAGHLTAFDIAPDGSLSNRRVWADLGGFGNGDGICLDAEGAVWTPVQGNACAWVRQGGEVLQRIQLDRFCNACMLGGPDRATKSEKAGVGARSPRSSKSGCLVWCPRISAITSHCGNCAVRS